MLTLEQAKAQVEVSLERGKLTFVYYGCDEDRQVAIHSVSEDKTYERCNGKTSAIEEFAKMLIRKSKELDDRLEYDHLHYIRKKLGLVPKSVNKFNDWIC